MTRSLLAYLVTIISTIGHAQEYVYKNLTTEDGLPSNMVYEVSQDSKGFLWYSTDAGVSKYDGNQFINYTTKEGLGDNEIFHTYEDSKGRIWFLSYNGKISYLFNNKIYNSSNTNYLENADSQSYLNCIFEDSEGTIWIGTKSSGVVSIDKYNVVRKFKPKLQLFDFKESSVNYIFQNALNEIVVLTNAGKYRVNTKIFQLVVDHQNDHDYYNLIKRSAGNLIRGSLLNDSTLLLSKKDQLFVVDANNFNTRDVIQKSEIEGEIIFLHLSNDNFVWVGTRAGAFKYGNANIYQEPTSFLQGYSISSLVIDLEDNTWFSTLGEGAFMLPFARVESLNYMLQNDNVTSLDLDRSSKIWVGQELGFYSSIGKDNTVVNYRIDDQNTPQRRRIYGVFHDSFDNRWVLNGTRHTYLFNKKMKPLDISNNSLRDIVELKSGRLFTGGSHGLFEYNVSQFQNTLNDCNDPECSADDIEEIKHYLNERVNRLLYDETSDLLWIGTTYGLKVKDGDEVVDLGSRHPKLKSNITGLAKSPDGTIWVSTYGEGVFHMDLDTKVINRISVDDGLSSEMCNNIFLEDVNSVWVATNKGLNKLFYNGKESLKITLIDVNDGLSSDQINDVVVRQNQIYVGTKKGLNLLDKGQVPEILTPIPIFITDISVGDNKIMLDSTGQINLTHDFNGLRISFAGVSYTTGDNTLFRYRFNKGNGWQYTSSTMIEVPSIAPGAYRFEVQARNKQGAWSQKSALFELKISSPWWDRWWAYLIYTIVLIIIMGAIYRYEKKRQLLKTELELEKVQLNKVKEIEQMKSSFFSNVSHEFRTPLTLILGPLEKLLESNNDPGTQRSLQLIRQSAKSLQNLINQLLDISKLEAGKLELQLSRNDIVSDLQLLAERFKLLAVQKKIEFNFNCVINSLVTSYDAKKVEVIVNNLLSNAIKFTSDGGIISMDVELIEDSKTKYLKISIQDSGVGIAPSELSKIFNRFYQVDDSNNKQYDGTGIGLSLVKELTELHGGKIDVHSKVGKGTTFEVSLPILNEEVVKGESKLVESTSENGSVDINNIIKTKRSVLVVEDNIELQTYIKGLLDKEYDVTLKNNGLEALESISNHLPELVLSDVMMPKMDGFIFCERLKSNEQTSHIPIILLTAKSAAESKLEGLELGADDYLTKPFDHRELLARVRNLINQREQLWKKFKNTQDLMPIHEKVGTMDKAFLERAVKTIEENFGNHEFDVGVFVREIGMSRTLVHQKLKSLTGQSTSEFIHIIKLRRAHDLIQEGTGNISDVAYQVGYRDVQYFSKRFKKLYKKTPSEVMDRH